MSETPPVLEAALAGESTAFFRDHPELRSSATVTQLAEAARSRVRVNAREALPLAEAALALAEEIGDAESTALGLRAKANVLWFLNRNPEAIDLYSRASSLFHQLGNEIEVGRTISSSIQPLIRTGEYTRALDEAARARAIFETAGDGLRLTRLELNVANIYHRQDRFEEALAIYERAYRRLVRYQDTEGVAVALHNMAVCLIPLNDFRRAMETYTTARAFFLEHQMPALVFQVDYNIAYLYHFRGVYSQALRMLSEAQESSRRTGDAYHAALCHLDQSEIYLELNMNDEAAETAGEAHQQFQALEMPYEAGKSLTHLAIATGQRGAFGRSLELFAQAKEIFTRENNRVWCSLIDLYQAMAMCEEGRFADAQVLCSDALEFFRARQIGGKEILCHLLLARLALRGGDWREARAHCSRALDRLREIEAPHLEYLAHFQMGQIEEAAGNRENAAQAYRAAGAGMENLRSLLHAEELKVAFMKNKVDVYEGLIRLCLDGACSGARERLVFDYMEAAKSRSLRDLMFERHHPAEAGGPDESGPAREIRELREELNWYYRRLADEQMNPEGPSRDRTARLQQEMARLENRLLRLLREMPPGEPEATGIRGAPALTLETIQQALDPDTALIEYFRAGERIVGAVITRSGIGIFPLGELSRVRVAARMLHFQLSRFSQAPRYAAPGHAVQQAAINTHLRELYEQLLAPLLPSCRRLIFVPHELLHHLPLHALFDGSRYVMDRFQVAYAPSASVYALCRTRPANTAGPSLILGVPDPQAPFIRDEVAAVAETVAGPRQFVGEAATRDVLRDLGPASRLIHIATHGRFRRDNPMFSAIRLGDGYLTLYDLYQFRLPAEHITLSGCSTGLNVVAAGDELLGLVRGFLRAGAKSLMLSLWDIHDRTAAGLMRAFYAHWQRQPNQAAALQAAMQEIRERHPHPYFWAPFILTGACL